MGSACSCVPCGLGAGLLKSENKKMENSCCDDDLLVCEYSPLSAMMILISTSTPAHSETDGSPPVTPVPLRLDGRSTAPPRAKFAVLPEPSTIGAFAAAEAPELASSPPAATPSCGRDPRRRAWARRSRRLAPPPACASSRQAARRSLDAAAPHVHGRGWRVPAREPACKPPDPPVPCA